MFLVQYREFLNDEDNFSIILAISFGTILGIYVLYVLYFTCFKVGPWTRHEKTKKLEEFSKKQKMIHEEMMKKSEQKDKNFDRESIA